MSKLDWIKELVRAEQQMEESGMVDFSASFDDKAVLKDGSIELLKDLKNLFIESASAFNQLRGLSVGGVKIYGISHTASDFMLFRNGYKLLFTLKSPGLISIRFSFQGSGLLQNGTEGESSTAEDLIEASWGAFGELSWSYQGRPVKKDYLVRYYLSRFISESAR